MLASSKTLNNHAVNFCILPKPVNPISEPDVLERKGLERAAQFKRLESAYAVFHATKSATTGYVLAVSPVSLLAWYPRLESRSHIQR